MLIQNTPRPGVDRFVEEEIFEQDLRAALKMMRPNRRERLLGWQEYRTGGTHFRATISWDDDYQKSEAEDPLAIPHLAEILEAILVGSVKSHDDIGAHQEFALYRDVVLRLLQRLSELEACYD